MFQSRHFEAIAEDISAAWLDTVDPAGQDAIVCLAGHLADTFKDANSNFDRIRFYSACELFGVWLADQDRGTIRLDRRQNGKVAVSSRACGYVA